MVIAQENDPGQKIVVLPIEVKLDRILEERGKIVLPAGLDLLDFLIHFFRKPRHAGKEKFHRELVRLRIAKFHRSLGIQNKDRIGKRSQR